MWLDDQREQRGGAGTTDLALDDQREQRGGAGTTDLAVHDLELLTDVLPLSVGALHQQVDDGILVSAWEGGREGGRVRELKCVLLMNSCCNGRIDTNHMAKHSISHSHSPYTPHTHSLTLTLSPYIPHTHTHSHTHSHLVPSWPSSALQHQPQHQSSALARWFHDTLEKPFLGREERGVVFWHAQSIT